MPVLVSVRRASALVAFLAASAVTAQPFPQGGAFPLNLMPVSTFTYPSARCRPDGTCLAAWANGVTGTVETRAFAADGTPAAVTAVLSDQTGGSGMVALGMDAAGGLVAAWQTWNATTTELDVAVRRLTPAGVPLGSEVIANTERAGWQYGPVVAVAADGRFVVVWQSGNGAGSTIEGQRFDASGARVGGQFRISTGTGTETLPAAAMASGGAFVVSWSSNTGTAQAPSYLARARRYDAAGVAQGAPFTAHTPPFPSIIDVTSVGMDAAGGFVVVWSGVSGQRFLADGTRVGGEFRISQPVAPAGFQPAIAMEASGAFVVTWGWEPSGIPRSVYARSFAADATPVGVIVQASATPTRFCQDGRAALGQAGTFLVVWACSASTGAGTDLYGRRFGPTVVAAEPAADATGLTLGVAPNPASGAAVVRYETREALRVRVSVVDVRGRTVAVLADRDVAAGPHEARLDTAGLAPGVYVVHLEAGGVTLTRRVTVAR